MKKLIIIIFFISLPLLSKAQLSGSGTYADPWSGTLDGDATWSGTVYIDGDITVDDEKLTISAGAIIIFLSESADLIITGTGQIEADGTSGNMIRFTSDDDDDGNYGETGERWGHISFQSMGSAGASVISYCIIEYGRKAGAINTLESVGGGLQVDFNNITISDNIFRNNYAFFGGAVFVNAGKNPSITNCYFLNNTAREAGGGLYVYNSSASVISNCIFEGNYADGTLASYYSGGAIQFGSSITNAKVINSTFVNNTSDNTGDAFFTLSGGTVTNSIFWGSNDQIGFNSSGGTVNYSAIQGYSPGTHFNNCFDLNSSNTAPDGPNFVATDGSDWSIIFISPCRDAGTTPSPTVPNDYDGNPRIGPYDIGAYEVQYSRWTGGSNDKTWTSSGNWDGGVPTTSSDIIIPTGLALNYPIIATSPPDFEIGSGKIMILEPEAKATFGTLTNNGLLKLQADADSTASLILNTYSGSGTEEIQLYLTGGGGENTYKWHYISTPVSSLSTDVFTGVTPNLAQYIESRPSYDLMAGWVTYAGIVYTGGTGPTFNVLTPGKGYNFFDDVDNAFSFGGSFNTSNVVMSLSFTDLPSMHGFNLLGNPFSSGLDWNYIISDASYPESTSKGLYFTRDNEQCTYIGGVGVPEDVTGIIPPMQGFFTKTYAEDKTITLPTAARTHNTIHSRYKGTTIIPLIRLKLTDETASYDETVVRFDELAKTSLDYDFDALKMFISKSKNQIYTSIDGKDYAINGQPFPLESSLEVPAVIEIPVIVNLTIAGNYKISATQLQGIDETYDVTFIDNTTGFTADLKKAPELIFSSAAGTFKERFKLFVSISTGIEQPESSKSMFNIYPHNGMINIVPLADEWTRKSGSVNILDMTGKYIGNLENIEFQKNAIVQLQAPEIKGLYFVEIRSGVKRHVGKVVIK